MSHPFGDLLSHHLHRKHGLSQAKLAEGILQDPSIVGKMCKGQRLNGPQARERVCAIIGWLRQQAVLTTVDEANQLLVAAGMAPMNRAAPAEQALLQQLSQQPSPEPPPAKPLRRPTNLLTSLTSFVGRIREVTEVSQLVATQRLVTLTGAGGVGKTRLALEVGKTIWGGSSQTTKFPDGVWVVELASLPEGDRDPMLVAQTIARLFHCQEQAGQTPLAALEEYLANKQLLLVLDNCEHLVAACATVSERLLQRCWQLHILATSREELRIPGETLYPVLSLALPSPTEQNPARVLEASSAQLFVERMLGSTTGAKVPENELATLAHICHQLDGIPLALEMAAPLTRSLSLAEIARQLDNQMALLTNNYRTAIPRHQTMHSALVWSYRLLSSEEQRLLARASVFAGGWTLEAAQAVCFEANSPVTAADVASLLQQLSSKSWLLTERLNDQRRYRLLEPVRQFAQHLLSSTGALEAGRDRHAAYFCNWLQQQEAALKGKGAQAALLAMETIWPNLSAAWDWAIQHGKIIQVSQAVESLACYYDENAQFQRGEIAHQQAIATLTSHLTNSAQTDAVVLLLARLLAWQIQFSWEVGHEKAARQAATQSLQLLACVHAQNRASGLTSAFVLRQNAYLASFLDETERAKALAEESLLLYQEVGNAWGMALAHYSLGFVYLDRNDRAAARQHYLASLQICEQQGDDRNKAHVLTALGWLAMDEYQYDEARRWFTATLALAEVQSSSLRIGDAHQNLGLVDLAQGCFATAALRFPQSIVCFREQNLRSGPATSLAYQGLAEMFCGKFNDAQRALEASLAIATELQTPADLALAHLFLGHLNLHQGHFAVADQQVKLVLANPPQEDGLWLVGYAHTLLACVALVEKKDDEAQASLAKGQKAFAEGKKAEWLAWVEALGGYLAWRQGRLAAAYQHLDTARQQVVATAAYFPLLFLLPFATLLANTLHGSEPKNWNEATEADAQTKRCPLITQSRWFAEIVGVRLAAVDEMTSTVTAAATVDAMLSFDKALTILNRTFKQIATLETV